MTLAGWLNPVVTNNTLINSPLYTELSQTGLVITSSLTKN